MAAREYAFTLTPGNSSRTRSLAIACAAVAAVCVLSSTLVMRELVGGPTARAATPTAAIATATPAAATIATATPAIVTPTPTSAAAATTPAATAPTTPLAVTAPATTTPAPTWTLEPRWWSGEIRQSKRQAPTVPESELTFAKGYQLRLAARQATQPAVQPASPATEIVAAPTTENQPGRATLGARKASTLAHTETPTVRRINATPADSPANPLARFDTPSRALAYDEQRPSERGFVHRSAPSRGLFGTLY